MGTKQKTYIAGLYLRLSHDDECAGESLSIDNQRMILRKYAEERGFEIHDEYIDDGVSGTTFQRPQVQRLLDDAKTGVINTILVKDLSRFGRNYIEVGQYVDYVFPSFGIRFIAIQDNIDTENRDNNAMELMPIVNVFNEWHAANTSKKIRSVFKAKSKEGVFHSKKPVYGYLKSTDAKRTLIIDEEVAPNVVRIFEMYASGISPRGIVEILNEENLPSPAQYAKTKFGFQWQDGTRGIWCQASIKAMLNNMTYLGHLALQRTTTVSYKNHKRYNRDKSEWVILYNTHEPIISQELWDKVQERQKSVAIGKRTKSGFTPTLSGFLFCADCGGKMKMTSVWSQYKQEKRYAFNCGNHERFGKSLCFSHHIPAKTLENIVLEDIREMAKRIVLDEDSIRKEFVQYNNELADKAMKSAKKELHTKQKRAEELTRLIQAAYEDKVIGKVPEDICLGLIEKYSAEQKAILPEIAALETKISESESSLQNVDDFIRNIKKYLDAPELTREMCYELLDRVVVGGVPRITGKERTIEIVYKVDIASVLRHKFQK